MSKRKQPKKTPAAPEPPTAGGRVRLTGRPEWWGRYIIALVETGEVSSAAAAAGVSRKNVYERIEGNPELAEEAEEARGLRAGMVRKTLLDVGTKGIVLPLYAPDRRTIIGYETKFFPQVLLKLAESLPEYRQVSRGSSDGKPEDERPSLTDSDADQIVDAIARRVDQRRMANRPRLAEE